MKTWMLSLLLGCAACAGSSHHDHGMQPGAAEALDAGPSEVEDAAQAMPAPPAEADIHFAVIALLVELERSLQQRCACEVEAGQFVNMQMCEDATSLGPNWADCVNRVDIPDNEHARAQLRCETLGFIARTDCLATSPCTDDAIAECLRDKSGCGELDLSVLNPVALQCADSLTLNH